LLKHSPREVENNRVHTLRELSRCWGGCRVLLKGHQSISGQYREPLYVNNSGNPKLAQGGSGDLLAGYLAGLLAQPAMQSKESLAIQYAVWQHGAAADRLSETRSNWTIEDLASVLGQCEADSRADKSLRATRL
jgi:NAD(P)H-hydrate repair Nnr-like enzyme with NAD(P)H-hydrate dehydratase domain